jgi:hypothetical protein
MLGGSIVLIALAAAAHAAPGDSFPRISAGGGFAGKAAAAELTLSPFLGGPHISAGADLGPGERYGYLEVTATLWVTGGLAIGKMYGTGQDEQAASRWHMILSTQIPLFGWEPRGGLSQGHAGGFGWHDDPMLAPRLLYLAPFIRWRQAFGAALGDATFGALLKLSFGPY